MAYIQGDIHEVIKTLDDNSIDFIYTDPPFAITEAKWDKPLRWEELFKDMWRVLKPTGVICLYASMPFTYELLRYERPKYHYTWIKNNSTGFFQAKFQPLRVTEEIFIYYKKKGQYYPQMIGDEYHQKRNVIHGGKQNYYGTRENITENHYTDEGSHRGRYPTTHKNWKIRKDESGVTRTDEQIDYFIKTYSKEGDTILDMTCCNKYVGDRCNELSRHYIGVDIRPIV
jgi:site-specific DNA-methyltransferase (adenine-specific)